VTRTLYRNGVVHSASHPFAQALMVEDGVITWLGDEDTADQMDASETIDLDGALVTPAFVDAAADLAGPPDLADAAAHGIVSVHTLRWAPGSPSAAGGRGSGAGDPVARVEVLGYAPASGRLALDLEHVSDEEALLAVESATRGQGSVALVVGSAASEQRALDAFEAASERTSVADVARAGHRIVGLRDVCDATSTRIVRLGLRVTLVAPNLPLASAASAGLAVSLGGLSRDPWGLLLQAMTQELADERVSARAAFRAATRGGWRAVGHDDVGELRPGAVAHLALWRASHLGVQGPRSAWSSDARAGTPLLPFLEPDEPRPTCLRTVRAGTVIHDTLG
jgi:hypothetical protein